MTPSIELAIPNTPDLFPFILSALIAVSLTPFMRRIAIRIGVADGPGDSRKVQTTPVPYLGGVAITVACVSTTVVAAAYLGIDGTTQSRLMWIVVPALVLAILGLLDDLRGLSPFSRFIVQSVAALLTMIGLISSGTVSSLTNQLWLDAAVTLIWVIGVTNALNLLDNMDGLAAGCAFISAFGYFLLASISGQFLVAALALTLSGATFGFLIWNRYPASIYMGDAGSLFIGFLLAAIAIRIDLPASSPGISIGIIVLFLFVPLLDTSLVVITRLARGTSPFKGGLDHISHRLRQRGLSVWHSVTLLWGMSAFAAVAGVSASRSSGNLPVWILATSCLLFLVLLGIFARMPIWTPNGD